MTIKSILAWLSRPFTKGKTMTTDTVDTSADTSALAATADTSAQSAAIVTAALDAPVPAAVVVPVAPVAAAPAAKTEFEKLEELIDKYSLDSVEKVKAAIQFIRTAL